MVLLSGMKKNGLRPNRRAISIYNHCKIYFGIFLFLLTSISRAQQGPMKTPPIVLGAGDTATFPHAPVGYDSLRANILHGKIDSVEYFSTSVGNKRMMLVYTPPGYSKYKKYPILFLLHGIGGDAYEWHKWTTPDAILDNLYADGKIVPIIVVYPNGRAQPDDRATGNVFTTFPAFEKFENDLITDIIPFMQANYPLKNERESRAIAGYSMGGGQSLNIGLTNLNTFAWIGAFSSAPNTKAPAQLFPNPAETSKKLKLLYISCGDKDGLIFISQGIHKYLLENKVPHIWQVDVGGHEMSLWASDLYIFSQMIFK